MRRTPLIAAIITAAALAARTAHAAPEILPLDQVHPGMKGVGRTVFEGTKIENVPRLDRIGVAQPCFDLRDR